MPFITHINPDTPVNLIWNQLSLALQEIEREFHGVVRETWLQMHPQWTDSWTANSSYTDVTGSINQIDFDDWPYHDWLFEMIGFTDAGTGFWRLYNITDAEAVNGSEISTTATTHTRIRSSSIDKPQGEKSFKIQHYISGGGTADLVNSVMSRTVFRFNS